MGDKRAFDVSLDKAIWEKESVVSEKESIIVGVYSYDGKEPKIGFKRKASVKNREDGREFSYRKLGRLNKSEACLIQVLLGEAIVKMG